ncbi:phosphate/phosphite/phosphonate ABC transporter substrate-binding protein [Streptomyces sp. JW3]|uniref:phosphate/phosphite/phosphonate ABC transporter substrate-binding protein n=1 Tax=Streptomyces sp. JW3 TaxID=3456955 RepID=UPI003FA443DE
MIERPCDECGKCLLGVRRPSADDTPLSVAAIRVSEDPTAQNPVDDFADLLSKEASREVEITEVPDYMGVVESIRGGHTGIGVMSSFPTTLALKTGGADPLVARLGNSTPIFTRVVPANSPVKKLDDLCGKTLSFVDSASSSGCPRSPRSITLRAAVPRRRRVR